MKKETYISVSKFAQLMNVDESTIRYAIRTNKLNRCLVKVNGRNKIIPSVGKREFNYSGIGINSILKPKRNQLMCSEGGAEYYAAILKERVAKAKKAEIEVRILEESLVSKDDVYNELSAFIGEMKKKLQVIPEQITDELISVAGDRKTFYNLLVKSIDDALTDLANTKEVNYKPDSI
jgi:hypothetical protein